MMATIKEICESKITTGPHGFDEISDFPGVYRFEDATSSAALVIKPDGVLIYVSRRRVELTQREDQDKHQFWKTDMVAPDGIKN